LSMCRAEKGLWCLEDRRVDVCQFEVHILDMGISSYDKRVYLF
jgi:hypothetical protein